MFSDQNIIVCSCLFKTAPGDSFERVPVPIFIEKIDCGAIFNFRDFQKGTFWRPFSANRLQRRGRASYSERPCRDTAFHETKLITCRWDLLFLNGRFGVRQWPIFVFVLPFCVLFFPSSLITIFDNPLPFWLELARALGRSFL